MFGASLMRLQLTGVVSQIPQCFEEAKCYIFSVKIWLSFIDHNPLQFPQKVHHTLQHCYDGLVISSNILKISATLKIEIMCWSTHYLILLPQDTLLLDPQLKNLFPLFFHEAWYFEGRCNKPVIVHSSELH